MGTGPDHDDGDDSDSDSFSSRQSVALLDLGLCMPYSVEEEDEGSFLSYFGTSDYSSERHLSQKVIGPSDDLISLGYMLLEMYFEKGWCSIFKLLSKESKKRKGNAQGGKQNAGKKKKQKKKPDSAEEEISPTPLEDIVSSQYEEGDSRSQHKKNGQDAAEDEAAFVSWSTRVRMTVESRNLTWSKLKERGTYYTVTPFSFLCFPVSDLPVSSAGLLPEFLDDWMKYCTSLRPFECPEYDTLRTLLLHAAPETAPGWSHLQAQLFGGKQTTKTGAQRYKRYGGSLHEE